MCILPAPLVLFCFVSRKRMRVKCVNPGNLAKLLLSAAVLLLSAPHYNGFCISLRPTVSISEARVLRAMVNPFAPVETADIDGFFSSFESQFYDESFDAGRMTRLHTDSIFSLVKSDVRNREEDSSQLELFPSSYKKALQFVDDLLLTLKDTSSPIYPPARMIVKKEGLNQLRSTIIESSETADIIMPQREIIDIKRKTERVLSQLMTLCIAYRSCQELGNERDLIYFSKVLLEKTPIHDRHFSLLLLSRGILAPPFATTGSRRKPEDSNRFDDVSSLVRSPRPGLTEAFKGSLAKLGVKQPSSTARILFPFACTALRCYRAVKSGAFDSSVSLLKQYHSHNYQQQQHSSRDSDHGAAISNRSRGEANRNSAAVTGTTTATSDADANADASASAGNTTPLESEKKVTTPQSRISSSTGGGVGSYTAEDLQLSRLLKACMDIDRESEIQRSMTEAADEVLTSMRRWICDLAAAHFINEDDGLFNQRENLPEEIRRNTVAMELVCTDRAFNRGKRLERSRFISFFSEIGRYIDVMSSFVTADTDTVGTGDDDQDVHSTHSQLYGPEHKFLVSMKKTIAAVSATKYLPRTHRLRMLMETGGVTGTGLFTPPPATLGASTPDTTVSAATSVPEVAEDKNYKRSDDSDSNKEEEDEDDGFVDIFADLVSDDNDDNMWASDKPQLKKRIDPVQKLANTLLEQHQQQATVTEKKLSASPAAVLSQQVDDYLLQVIADILRVNETAILEPQSKVREEVEYVFSSWRRPHYLMDYYRMHHSSPEIQGLFRRFLSALFGASAETFEDIRYKDPGNRRHLNLFPPLLVKQWVDGKTSDGKLLPGYSDPQTLFMVGEDCHTCMSIRARRKGTNRGLLSILLQGNIRVVGGKDSSGRLVTRSVVRLLVDDATKMPVLYVDTPYGNIDDEDSLILVYDQAAELGNMLKLPVIYAGAPPDSLYVMSDREMPAAVAKDGVDDDDDNDNDDYDDIFSGTGSSMDTSTSTRNLKLKRKIGTTMNIADLVEPLTNITDYSQICSLMWVDGIKDPQGESYLPTRSPLLTRRSESARGLAVGARTAGTLERMVAAGADVLPPVTQQRRVVPFSDPGTASAISDNDNDDDSDIFATTTPRRASSSHSLSSSSSSAQFDSLFHTDDDLFGDDDAKSKSVKHTSDSGSKQNKQINKEKESRRSEGQNDLFAESSPKKKRVTMATKVDFGEDSDFFGEAEKFVSFNKTAARTRGVAAQSPTSAASLAARGSAGRRLGDLSDPRSSQGIGMSKELLKSEDTNFEGSFLSTTMDVNEASSSAVSGGDYSSLLAALKNQQTESQKQAAKSPSSSSSPSSSLSRDEDGKPHKRQPLSIQARQAERNRMIRDHQFEAQRARGLRKDDQDSDVDKEGGGGRESESTEKSSGENSSKTKKRLDDDGPDEIYEVFQESTFDRRSPSSSVAPNKATQQKEPIAQPSKPVRKSIPPPPRGAPKKVVDDDGDGLWG